MPPIYALISNLYLTSVIYRADKRKRFEAVFLILYEPAIPVHVVHVATFAAVALPR